MSIGGTATDYQYPQANRDPRHISGYVPRDWA
uniref:Uncharacterized protein n=1 Tax=Salmonella phage vB_SE126_2P TaxID=3236704 RepID=A0AB39C3L5_9VIRU